MINSAHHIATHDRNAYPLEWLDLIITVTLNPAKTNVEAISPDQA